MSIVLHRHEHLYPGVEESLIRTDELPEDIRQVEKLFEGVSVVLSTLSSLSNPVVQQRVAVKGRGVEVNHLVVDEASQISVFQYLVSWVFFLGVQMLILGFSIY